MLRKKYPVYVFSLREPMSQRHLKKLHKLVNKANVIATTLSSSV